MSFYTIEIELNKEGNFGRRSHIPKGYSIHSTNSQSKLEKFAFPDAPIIFSDLILTPESSEVDVLSDGGAIGGKGLLVSDRFRGIGSKFNLGEHQFHSLTLISADGTKHTKKYHWLQLLVRSPFDWIDFQESSFSINDVISRKKKTIQLSSPGDLAKKRAEIDIARENIEFEKLVLNDAYNQNPVDLFFLFRLHRRPIISQRLRDAFTENSLTGVCEFAKASVFRRRPE